MILQKRHIPSPPRMVASIILVLSIGLFSLLPLNLSAQNDDIGTLFRAGAADANTLLESYLKPFGAGFGSNLNTGWINTARPYRPFGFDLRVNAAVAFVPDAEQMFDIAGLNLTQIEVIDNGSMTPTAFGDDMPGPLVGSTTTFTNEQGEEQRLFEFEMPQGSGYPYVPTPMAQLTIGVPMDTDLSIRFIPTLEFEELSFRLWGLGAKHSLNQWLPAGEALPVDLAIQAGFTNLVSEAALDVQPEIDSETEVPEGMEPGSALWDGQAVELTTSAFTANLLVGKTISVLSLYGGVGYHTSDMQIRSKGSYPVIELNTDGQGNVEPERPKIIGRLDDPLDLDLSGGDSLRALAGFRLRLGFIAISATYTHSKYPALSAGAGISFR